MNTAKTMSLAVDHSLSPAPTFPTSMKSTLISKNITVNHHRTSVRLEPAMWNGLTEICRRERVSVHVICSAVALQKPRETSLTAAIRVFVMSYFQAAATEEGHNRSGHGQGPATQAVNLLVRSILNPASMPHPLPSPHMIGKAYPPQSASMAQNEPDRMYQGNGQQLSYSGAIKR